MQCLSGKDVIPYLGGRVGDNVSTELNWANEISTSAKGVVDDNWDTSIVGNLHDGLEIRDVVPAVG